MSEDRRDISLKYVMDIQHPWEHDFPKYKALEAINHVARHSPEGYLTQSAPTIGWYEDKRLNLKMNVPTTTIDIVDQLIELVAPSGVYDDEEIIGGQFIPPETPAERSYREHSEQFEATYTPPVIREKPLRITQLPSHEDLSESHESRAKEAASERLADRARRLAQSRMYSESYGKFKKESDDITHDVGGFEDLPEEYFEQDITLGQRSRIQELEEGEEDAGGERYSTDLEYCPECDAYYQPGTHIHGEEDPTELEMLNMLEEEEYSDFEDPDDFGQYA